jgi:predicted transcriptional regulator of viral defense system
MCRIHPVTPREPQPSHLLQKCFGERPFRVSEAVAAGVSSSTLHRLRQKGELATVGRGMVQLPEAGMGMLSDLAVVSARVPRGTICLNSALAFWDLTDQIPQQVHLAVPRDSHRPSIDRPRTKVHVFNACTFDIDRQRALTDADEPFWIYSPERSVVDAMRMARWVGQDVALHGLRRYLGRPSSSPPRLIELARELGGGARLKPALEALLS